MIRLPSYRVLEYSSQERYLLLQCTANETQGLSLTNGAEAALERERERLQLTEFEMEQLTIVYQDSLGEWDQILYINPNCVRFRCGYPQETKLTQRINYYNG